MIRFITAMALLVAVAGAGTLMSSPAAANGYAYGHSRHHHQHHGHHRLHRQGFPFAFGAARILGALLPPPRRYYAPVYPRRCQRVIVTEYHFGRPARIGATLCTDRFGRAYIVPRSRYVIHYYR